MSKIKAHYILKVPIPLQWCTVRSHPGLVNLRASIKSSCFLVRLSDNITFLKWKKKFTNFLFLKSFQETLDQKFSRNFLSPSAVYTAVAAGKEVNRRYGGNKKRTTPDACATSRSAAVQPPAVEGGSRDAGRQHISVEQAARLCGGGCASHRRGRGRGHACHLSLATAVAAPGPLQEDARPTVSVQGRLGATTVRGIIFCCGCCYGEREREQDAVDEAAPSVNEWRGDKDKGREEGEEIGKKKENSNLCTICSGG